MRAIRGEDSGSLSGKSAVARKRSRKQRGRAAETLRKLAKTGSTAEFQGAFAWSGDAKKLSSNDSFEKNVAQYSKLGQNERFLLHWVGLGTL
jgi:hypothetical protein